MSKSYDFEVGLNFVSATTIDIETSDIDNLIDSQLYQITQALVEAAYEVSKKLMERY